jgi:O-antigen ligase
MVNENKNRFVISLLMLLVPIYLGRIQELIPFLSGLHIAKVTMGIALLIFVLTIKGYSEVNNVLREIPQIKYIIAIFVLALLSIPSSKWPGGSLDFFLNSFSILLLFIYLLIWCVNNEDELNKLCWSFVLSVLIIDITALVNPSLVKGRVFVSSTYDPNDMALLLVIAFPLMFYMMENHSGWKKLLLAVTQMMTLMIILKTGSRGGMVALVAVLAIIALQKGSGYIARRLPILALLVFIALSSATPEHMERFGTIFSMGSDYNMTTNGGRLEIWKRGIAILLHNPLLGCGVGQYETANGMMHGGTWQTAHNSFIQIGAELGIMGLVLFVLMLKRSITSLRESELKIEKSWLAKGTLTALYGFCVGGFFLSWAYYNATYFLIALAIIIQKIALNNELNHVPHTEE